MNKESLLGRERFDIAKFLFDGNESKAEALITLLESFTLSSVPSNLFSNLKMVIPSSPEYECHWCHNGDCWRQIPDSLFRCTGKCQDYEEDVL